MISPIPWERSLRTSVALLAIVLVGLLPVIGTNALFLADEGATTTQAALLSEHGTWYMPHGFPEADPDGDAFVL